MGLGALVVGVLKSMSHHSCPWDLVEYGGKACLSPVQRCPADSGPGRCFRAACLQRLYGDGPVFCFWRERPRLAWSFVVLGVVLGLAMGSARSCAGRIFLSQPVGRVVGLVFPGGGLRACFHPVC
jgi:membrane-associated PAP2 superfamily phosphatase